MLSHLSPVLDSCLLPCAGGAAFVAMREWEKHEAVCPSFLFYESCQW